MIDAPLNARELGLKSRAAVTAGDREGWLNLFTEDAFVQDPIGPSAFDPEGVRVITRLTESDPAALVEGQAMELRIVPLHRDEEGNDVVTYAFAPA